MANRVFILSLVSTEAILPRLDTIKAELSAHGFRLRGETHLNPGFSDHAPDPMGDAFSLTMEANLTTVDCRALSQHLGTAFKLDAIIQDKQHAQTAKKLACFDMDSTLIQHEVMDELAYRYGIGEKISAITELAMRGEISFKESFEQRLSCLKGFDATLIPGIAQSLKLMPGAEVLVKTLRAKGTKVMILSGGFENFAVYLQQALGPLDAIYSNILEVENSQLTGKIENQLIDESRKLALIKELARKQGIENQQTIAVGDGANDIPMLLHAGLGIAYHAKPLVQEKAQHCINHTNLAAILYVLGYQRSEFVEL
jgi:phosphoserine phosphatase